MKAYKQKSNFFVAVCCWYAFLELVIVPLVKEMPEKQQRGKEVWVDLINHFCGKDKKILED